ncbi:MAG: tyrosine-type recombinase/integrase [Candidatus Bathyarchaeia archaeon]
MASQQAKNKSPACPECGSQKLWKDGIRYTATGQVQRYICRNCGYRFSEPNRQKPANLNTSKGSKQVQKNHTQIFKSMEAIPYYRQICAAQPMGAKNLAAATKESEKWAAGATEQTAADIKGKVIEFMWKLKKEAYSEATVAGYIYILETLHKRGANLSDPENVKEIIAKQEKWSPARKNQAFKAYKLFLKLTYGINLPMPKYKIPQKLPFIPTEEEIDQLIAGCSHQVATFLQLLKETGARCGEAFNLKWTDIDFATNTIRITPEKGSSPRIFKMSGKLASMLNNLPKKDLKVFTYKNTFYLRKTFTTQRKRIAYKLGNPRLLQIHFHTLRHWKATMEYAKTKDILHVMQCLGHKRIENTLKYTQLVNLKTDEYICKAAKTIEEATQLIEAGFEYVTEINNIKLFRKRK